MRQYDANGRRVPIDATQPDWQLRKDPSLVFEEKALHYKADLTDGELLMLYAIKEAPLTRQQRLVVYLCGERGWTFDRAGKLLGITRQVVFKHLEAARTKIQQSYQNSLDRVTNPPPEA